MKRLQVPAQTGPSKLSGTPEAGHGSRTHALALATLDAPNSIGLRRFKFSPDDSHLAVIQRDQQVQLWDLRLLRQDLAQMNLDWDLPLTSQSRIRKQKPR